MSPARLRVRALVGATLAAVLLFAASGCASGMFGHGRTQRSSSVVAYLYPNQSNPLPPTSIPVLRLPLRVGVAFVPSERGGDITELQKNALLQRVAAEFQGRDYIESIEVVPSTYLRPAGGFDNLDQVRRLLNIDVIALVAFDQVQFSNENLLSLTYWTIVGAYLFHGNKNDTQTLMESAVYDIASRHLLFRAPGASAIKASSAGVYVQEQLREQGGRGLNAATDDLIANLKVQLEDFRVRVKQAPGSVARIEHKPGYSGGGSAGAGWAAALAVLALARVVQLRRETGRVRR